MAQLLCEHPDIYGIEVPYPVSPTRTTNVFLVHSQGDWLLVDTGYDAPESAEALEAGLARAGVDRGRLTVFVTHSHVDHAGLLHLFPDCPVVMGGPTVRLNAEMTGEGRLRHFERFLLREGAPADLAAYAREVIAGAFTRLDFPLPHLRTVEDGDVVEVGALSFTAIHAPGHTAGHMVLLERRRGFLFAGDEVLPGMTPGIDVMPEGGNGFAMNLETLRRLRDLGPGMAFYGHNQFAGPAVERIEQLIGHHEGRKSEYLRLIGENPGATAFELMLARRRFGSPDAPSWQRLGFAQKVSLPAMAGNVCRALADEGGVACYEGDAGEHRYRLA